MFKCLTLWGCRLAAAAACNSAAAAAVGARPAASRCTARWASLTLQVHQGYKCEPKGGGAAAGR